MKGSDGEVPLAVPRDRGCSFEPELVRKGQTWIDGVDKIIGLYAAGLSDMPCLRHRSAHFAPALCSPKMPIICSSVNLDLPPARSLSLM